MEKWRKGEDEEDGGLVSAKCANCLTGSAVKLAAEAAKSDAGEPWRRSEAI